MLYNKQERGNGAFKGWEGCDFKQALLKKWCLNTDLKEGSGRERTLLREALGLCLLCLRSSEEAVFIDTGPSQLVQMECSSCCRFACPWHVRGWKAVGASAGSPLWFSCPSSSPLCPVPVAPPGPEWAQQELGRTAPWRAAVAESWFPCSNLSGASSNLMESFW